LTELVQKKLGLIDLAVISRELVSRSSREPVRTVQNRIVHALFGLAPRGGVRELLVFAGRDQRVLVHEVVD
jgi:hypothetical protein